MAESQEHKPTDDSRRLAKHLSGIGAPQEDICHILVITKPTLHKHYRTELDLGMAEANAKVAEGLFKQVMNGNTGATIFWLKARCGWREVQDVNLNKKVSYVVALPEVASSVEAWVEKVEREQAIRNKDHQSDRVELPDGAPALLKLSKPL